MNNNKTTHYKVLLKNETMAVYPQKFYAKVIVHLQYVIVHL